MNRCLARQDPPSPWPRRCPRNDSSVRTVAHPDARRRGTSRPLAGVAVAAAILCGCGTNWQELVSSAATAASRTFLDSLLTDLANDLLASAESDEPSDGNDGDGEGSDGEGGTSLVGDSARGQSLYNAGGCGACHCNDAGGGCAAGALAILDATAETIQTTLRSGNHPLQVNLTEQQHADLEAFLASVGADN